MAIPSWIKLNKTSGTGSAKIEVTAAPNLTTMTNRNSVKVKTLSGKEVQVVFWQDGRLPVTLAFGGTLGDLDVVADI